MEHWLEQEIAQWVHPMKDRSDDPLHHEWTLLPRSYQEEEVEEEEEEEGEEEGEQGEQGEKEGEENKGESIWHQPHTGVCLHY